MSGISPSRARVFERFAIATLACTVVVIIWGAVVRATGSGAGCGAHWPLCNGVVVPLAPRVATIIELTHRVTSGLLLIGALGLAAGARVYPRGHAARRAAAVSFVFVVLEALIGAGIVLLRLVEDDTSALRAGYIAGHLVNTLFLVAALTATVWASRERPSLAATSDAVRHRRWFSAALAALLVVSASGAVVALGDTLFPHATFAAGFAADFDTTSHFLIRLRIWHPIVATATSLGIVSLISRSGVLDDAATGGAARTAIGLVVVQMALGAVNVLMAAPLALQMAHLAVANAVWIAMVWIWLPVRGAAARA